LSVAKPCAAAPTSPARFDRYVKPRPGEDTIIDAPLRPSVWRGELIETIKLAGPLALTQLGQIAMMTIDLALIGRLGNNAVAAAALAHGVCSPLHVKARFGRGGCAARRAARRASRAWSGVLRSGYGLLFSSARRSVSCN
jgi:hypothetical protein